MTEKDTDTIGYDLITTLEYILKKYYGEKTTVKIVKTDIIYSLSTENFILTYYIAEKHFFLTFKVGLPGKVVANDMKLIMIVFEADEITMMEDSYLDKKDGLVFGLDAIHAKQHEIITAAGKYKCPLCEKIYEPNQMVGTGICKYCNMDKILWN